MIGPIVSLSIVLATILVLVAPQVWNWLSEWLPKVFAIVFLKIPSKLYRWEQEYMKYGREGRRHTPRNVYKLTWVGADDSWADTLHDMPKVTVR